jgi:hypothetical protein
MPIPNQTPHRRKVWTPTKEQWRGIADTLTKALPFLHTIPSKWRNLAIGATTLLGALILVFATSTTTSTETNSGV